MSVFISPLACDEAVGERVMLRPLLAWLESRRWIRDDSIVIEELAVNGRRVDVSVLTRSGTLSAFELKLGGFGRALEQAYYNRRMYDRSWMVVGSRPKPDNLREAMRADVGVLVYERGGFVIVCRPGPPRFEAVPRRRLASRIRYVVRNDG